MYINIYNFWDAFRSTRCVWQRLEIGDSYRGETMFMHVCLKYIINFNIERALVSAFSGYIVNIELLMYINK